MGLLQISSRIGAASAPWVAKGLKSVHHYAPFLVMGVSSLVASALLTFLPETKGQKTVEVTENTKTDTLQGPTMEVDHLKDILPCDPEKDPLQESTKV